MTPPISGFLPGEEEPRIEHYRHLPVAEEFAEVAALNRAEAERQRADIRARCGDIPEEEIRIRLGVLRLGGETMTKVLGWDPATLDGTNG